MLISTVKIMLNATFVKKKSNVSLVITLVSMQTMNAISIVAETASKVRRLRKKSSKD